MLEALTSIKQVGSDMILTYYVKKFTRKDFYTDDEKQLVLRRCGLFVPGGKVGTGAIPYEMCRV